ncbi:MAG: SDR family NAD(P)-dependent oxidoreductase [Nanobdellota archaeon]
MDLRNKVAIITGAARGIGRAVAFEFAKEGAKLVISDVDIDNCELLGDELEDKGYDVLVLECDVSRKKDVDSLIKKTMKYYERIDVLVNCASDEVVKPFFEVSEREWNHVVDTNLKGMFLLTQAVAKIMAVQKQGKIVSISSIAGEVGLTYTAPFCASKAGIINLTRELALELSEYNINVNVISSGILPTKITKDILEDRKTKQSLLENIPLKKIGKPYDIARSAVFLASEKSKYVTGHNLVVDGGWLCH